MRAGREIMPPKGTIALGGRFARLMRIGERRFRQWGYFDAHSGRDPRPPAKRSWCVAYIDGYDRGIREIWQAEDREPDETETC